MLNTKYCYCSNIAKRIYKNGSKRSKTFVEIFQAYLQLNEPYLIQSNTFRTLLPLLETVLIGLFWDCSLVHLEFVLNCLQLFEIVALFKVHFSF